MKKNKKENIMQTSKSIRWN